MRFTSKTFKRRISRKMSLSVRRKGKSQGSRRKSTRKLRRHLRSKQRGGYFPTPLNMQYADRVVTVGKGQPDLEEKPGQV